MKQKTFFRDKCARFMMTHNGTDALNMAMICVAFGLAIADLFVRSAWLGTAESVLVVLTLLRFFSRNKVRRQAENRRFLAAAFAVKAFFLRQINRVRDRKTHLYKKCPRCKKYLRLPRVGGTHRVICPLCKENFSFTVK